MGANLKLPNGGLCLISIPNERTLSVTHLKPSVIISQL